MISAFHFSQRVMIATFDKHQQGRRAMKGQQTRGSDNGASMRRGRILDGGKTRSRNVNLSSQQCHQSLRIASHQIDLSLYGYEQS